MKNDLYTAEEIDELRYLRNLELSVEERLDQGTINPGRPGIDDENINGRIFETMADYKEWCAKLPKWMGYGKADNENDA